MSNINDQNTNTSDKTITNSDNDSGKTNPNSGKTTTISNNNNNVPPIQSHKHNHIGILPIQPNIPSNFILTRSNSRRIVSQKSVPTFPTKTLRMKSLLWTKPTGVAIDCWPSTIKQVSQTKNSFHIPPSPQSGQNSMCAIVFCFTPLTHYFA